MKTNSWMIISNQTGEAVQETFSLQEIMTVNRNCYSVASTADYLADFNRQVKANGGTQPENYRYSGPFIA